MLSDLLKNYNGSKKRYFDALRSNMRDLINKKQDKVLFNCFDKHKNNLRRYLDKLIKHNDLKKSDE